MLRDAMGIPIYNHTAQQGKSGDIGPFPRPPILYFYHDPLRESWSECGFQTLHTKRN